MFLVHTTTTINCFFFNFRCDQRSDVRDITEAYARYIPTVSINAEEQLSERFSTDINCNALDVNI